MHARRHTLILPLLAIVAVGPAPAASPPRSDAALARRVATERPAIAWETSLTSARAKATKAGKPLLVLHLFGRLDEAFC